MVYAIDRSICNGCDACSSTCPTHAISHDVKAEKKQHRPRILRFVQSVLKLLRAKRHKAHGRQFHAVQGLG